MLKLAPLPLADLLKFFISVRTFSFLSSFTMATGPALLCPELRLASLPLLCPQLWQACGAPVRRNMRTRGRLKTEIF